MQTTQGVEAAAMELTITRADGRVERLGVVGYSVRSPIKRAYLALRRRLGLPIRPEHIFG